MKIRRMYLIGIFLVAVLFLASCAPKDTPDREAWLDGLAEVLTFPDGVIQVPEGPFVEMTLDEFLVKHDIDPSLVTQLDSVSKEIRTTDARGNEVTYYFLTWESYVDVFIGKEIVVPMNAPSDITDEEIVTQLEAHFAPLDAGYGGQDGHDRFVKKQANNFYDTSGGICKLAFGKPNEQGERRISFTIARFPDGHRKNYA